MRVILLALATATQLYSQPAPRVEFEVVSVKPGDPNDFTSGTRRTPGGIELFNNTLNQLVRNAYKLNQFQLTGGPKWAGTARFMVVGKFPQGATPDQSPLMLQALLVDRFKLEFHRETRTLQTFELVVAKGGPKLQEATEAERHGGSSVGPEHLEAKGVTMSELAGMLIRNAGGPVIDRTGITGQYTIALRFAPLMDGKPGDENLPDMFVALQ
jgi:uncharacterized protein (TIGR03435 family)